MSDSNVPPDQPPMPPPPPPPPAGPPMGAGGPAGAAPGGFTIGNAFNYGWTKFQQNMGPIILAVLGIFVVIVVLEIVSFVVQGAMSNDVKVEYDPNSGTFETSGGGFFGASLFVSIFFSALIFMATLIIQAGVTKGALSLTRGESIDLGGMFKGFDFAQIVIAAIIVGIATGIGLVLCIIPGLIVAFFTGYTNYFIIDKHMSAMDAIKASVGFVKANLGTLILFALASWAAMVVGGLLCGIGLLVAIPVVVIAQAYAFRTLQGETVAP